MNEHIHTTVERSDRLIIEQESNKAALTIMMECQLFKDAYVYRDATTKQQAQQSKLAALEYVRDLVVEAIGAVKSELQAPTSSDLDDISNHQIALCKAENEQIEKRIWQEQADADAKRRAETERHLHEQATIDAAHKKEVTEATYRAEGDAAVKRHKVAKELRKREAVEWEVLNACIYAGLDPAETWTVLCKVTEGDQSLQ